MSFDFARWAVVSHNDDTGLGRLAQDTKAVLGVRQLVTPSERMTNKPLEPGRDVLLRPEMSEGEMEAALAGLDGLIMLERYWWHPLLLKTALRCGVRTTVLPTWEWFRGREPEWGSIDAILCPTEFSLRVVRRYGWRNAQVIAEPLDLRRFPAREVRGHGRTFFHNAGLIDPDDRKGTRDTILAFRRLKRSDVRLIVRLQQSEELPATDDRIDVQIGNLPDHGALYAEGDVAIQPSKMEGIGFMVIEPVISGIPTITLDYPPMSDHVTHPELRIKKRWFKRSCFPRRAAGVRHAHLRLPNERDLVRRIEWCADHDLTQISRDNRAAGIARYDGGKLRDEWSRVLGALRK
jgi:hypothetical protein